MTRYATGLPSGRRRLADVVQRADMRMIECGDAPRLALETGLELGVGCEQRREDLDGDRSSEPGVSRLIHLAHSPCADQRDDLVRTEAGAGLDGHGRESRALYVGS